MPKHEASALRISIPKWPQIAKTEKKRERGRGSVTWLWGPIILLGGGGWGWGEPWGPGGPCGIAQNKRGKEEDKRRERGRMRQKRGREKGKRSDKRGSEKEAGLLQGRRQCKKKKCTKIRCEFSCTEHSTRERLGREEQANDLALSERKETERWRGCVLFCLSVKTLRGLLYAACYQC